MSDTREVIAETAAMAISIAAAVLVIAEGRTLKPGVFEPIGPGAVPMGVAAVTIALALVILLQRIWRSARARSVGSTATTAPDEAELWLTMLAVLAVTIAYVGAMHWTLVGYRVGTVAFLAATILLAAEDRRRALPWALATAVVFGVALDYVFRHILVTDLP